MKTSLLVDKLLPSTPLEIDWRNSPDTDDEVLIEIADGEYKSIKEIFFIANPNRTILRLENGEDNNGT